MTPTTAPTAIFMGRGFEYGVIHWRSQAPGRLCDQIQSTLGLDLDKLRTLFDLGAIYDDQKRISDWAWLLEIADAGTYLRLHTQPRRFQIPDNLAKHVLFVAEDFLVLNKPAGIPCHPTVDNKVENLVFALSQTRGEDLFVTHRLDVGTSGLLILARNKEFQRYFNRLLSEQKVTKIYEAQLEKPMTGTFPRELTHYMCPSPRAPKKLSLTPQPGWSPCRLRILEFQDCQIRIELLTGRTHQIRAQLGFEGFPLAGDQLYGASYSAPFELRSSVIAFVDRKNVMKNFALSSDRSFTA